MKSSAETLPSLVTITDVSSGPGSVTIDWTTTPPFAPVDIYRSVDVVTWGAPISSSNAAGTYTDAALPGPAAYYVVVAAGTPFP